MSTQVFVVTTTYGLVTLVRRSLTATYNVERRVLLTSAQFNGGLGGTALEATGLSGAGSATGPTDLAGTGELLEAFDAVHSLNEACAPLSPAQWQPRRAELPIWRRLLSDRWGIDPDDDVRLILPGLDAEPGRSLALLFDDATIDAYADGLTAYGPSRAAVDAEIGHRVDRLIYPELVPGLRPLLYREWSATPTPVSPDALRKVLARIDRSPGWLADAEPGSVGVVLGHHLSGLELLDQGDEQAIDLTLIRTAAARPGIGRVVYKVPAAAAGCAAGLTALTRRQGLEVSLQVDPQLPETWFGHRSIGFVGSCPGNPLATAHGLYGLRSAQPVPSGSSPDCVRSRTDSGSHCCWPTSCTAIWPGPARPTSSPCWSGRWPMPCSRPCTRATASPPPRSPRPSRTCFRAICPPADCTRWG